MISRAQRGFTLIELVVVITILGILAAFALPKFITLDSTARAATINGLAGSVRSAASLARGLSMANGNASVVSMEGASITLLNNYPDSSATGISAAINTSGASDFSVTAGGTASGTTTWTKVGAVSAGSCSVSYTPPSVAGNTPNIAASTAGC